MIVLRSLLFYAVFYAGSVSYVLGSLACIALRSPRLAAVVSGWSCFHRACVTRILGMAVTIRGDQPAMPVLYAMKHESFFEAIDLPCLFDHPVVFAKEELFSIPGWGRAAAAYGVIPVARTKGASALRSMIRRAQELTAGGRPLVIFPEGTRVPHGTRPALQSGFAMLYKVLGLPVIPVAVRSGPAYSGFRKSGAIEIRFGTRIAPGLPRAVVEEQVIEAINALNAQS